MTTVPSMRLRCEPVVTVVLAVCLSTFGVSCDIADSPFRLSDHRTISGHVVDERTAGVGGVVIAASNGGATAVTANDGRFAVRVPNNWTGALSPDSARYAFDPDKRYYSNLKTDLTGQVFVAIVGGAPPPGLGEPIITDQSEFVFGTAPRTLKLVGRAATGDDLTFTVASPPSHGRLSPIDNSPTDSAIVVYSADDGFEGEDRFTFHAADGQGAAGSATFTLRVIRADGRAVVAGTVTRFKSVGRGEPAVGFVLSLRGDGPSTGADYRVVADSQGQFAQPVMHGWTGVVAADDPVAWNLTPARRVLVDTPPGVVTLDFTAGRNYYVAPDGRDADDGSMTRPFKTVQRGVNALAPGDACLVRGGVYAEQVRVTVGGAAGAPIAVRAYPGESPILDGQGRHEHGLVLDSASHVEIDGLAIRNYSVHGVFLDDRCNHCVVRNCVVQDVGWFGVYLRGGDDCIIEDNEAVRCRIGVRLHWRDSTRNFVQRAVVRRNLLHDMTNNPEENDGLSAAACLDSVFEDNVCWNCADDGIDVSSSSGREDVPQRCIIRRNYVWNSGEPTGEGDGNGIKVSTNAGGGHLIHHNICFRNARAGFDQDIEPGWDGNRFYNNVAWANTAGGFFIEGNNVDARGRAVLLNNIAWRNAGRGDLFAHHRPIERSDHNDWGVVMLDGEPGLVEGAHSISADPRFTDPDAAIVVDDPVWKSVFERWNGIRRQVLARFALKFGSPCIDAGTSIPEVTVDAVNAPDIGAVESGPR